MLSLELWCLVAGIETLKSDLKGNRDYRILYCLKVPVSHHQMDDNITGAFTGFMSV